MLQEFFEISSEIPHHHHHHFILVVAQHFQADAIYNVFINWHQNVMMISQKFAPFKGVKEGSQILQDVMMNRILNFGK
jgi:hypothetical protein